MQRSSSKIPNSSPELSEEPGLCPACFVHAEKTPKPSGIVPVLEHSGLRGGSVSVAGVTVGVHPVVSLPTCASTLPSLLKIKQHQSHSPNSRNLHLNLSSEKNNLSFEEKNKWDGSDQTVGSRVLICCRQETTHGFHAQRLSRVCAGKETLGDVPRYAAPKLRPSGTCRRKLRRPSTQCASCDVGQERLAMAADPAGVAAAGAVAVCGDSEHQSMGGCAGDCL